MSRRHVHPIVFLFLIMPFGALGGYLQVAIGYLLAQAGVSVEKIAALIAASYIPHVWKWAWAPIVDTTMNRRAWYIIGAVVSGVGFWATGALPATANGLKLLTLVVVVSNVAVTFLGMSVESLMAYGATPEEKGRAGGWFQAGNLGGNGLGGGAGLWMARHLPAPWMAGAALGVACILCIIGLFFVPEPQTVHRHENLAKSLWHVVLDLWGVAKSRMGFLALFLCFLPLGSGAASNLWSAVAKDWHASANTVAFVTGILNGIVSAVGCILGGWICDRMHRQWAYALFGVLQALCAVAMALTPHTESAYVLFTLLYALITGLTYAGFTAFVLEAMGLGAAAFKYNVFASLSNFPIQYVTTIDGWAHGKWGPSGMLLTEAALGGVGLMLFFTVFTLVKRLWPAPPGEEANAASLRS